jgi:hypothetical protein
LDIPFNDGQSWETFSQYLTGIWVYLHGVGRFVAKDQVGEDPTTGSGEQVAGAAGHLVTLPGCECRDHSASRNNTSRKAGGVADAALPVSVPWFYS